MPEPSIVPGPGRSVREERSDEGGQVGPPGTTASAGGRALLGASAELDAEDAKLVVLARGARARIGAVEGAAVRDQDGRTYAAATVALPSLTVTALQLAVASAAAAGAKRLEAAAVVTEASTLDGAGFAAVRDLSADAPVHVAGPDGKLIGTVAE